MSEAPERIKIWPDVNDHFNPPRSDWSSGHWDDTNDPTGTEYVHADLVQAMADNPSGICFITEGRECEPQEYLCADLVQAAVAAALTEAVERAHQADSLELATHGANKIAERILSRITPDAQAALDRVVEKRIEELKGQNNE